MICDKEKCTGCFACYNICPKNAIKMEEDEHGFIYPKINKELCTNCNACEKVCPSIENVDFVNPSTCYAAHVKDEEKRAQSTSGGMASLLSEYVINKNGIVYGAAFTKSRGVEHIRVDNTKDLEKLKGSKYVHSYIKDSFKNVLNDLKEDKEVLFVGTPCQVAGLKKYLRKEYEKLYCVDLICHGVPSQKYLKDEIQNINEEITRISFRSNDGFRLRVYSNQKILIDSALEDSTYYSGFMDATFYRENCYNCKYAKSERISDMTIGDFWGLSESSKLYTDKDKGVSVILINNEKGMNLFENCKSDLIYEEREVDEAVKGNTQLREPSKMKKDYKIFYKNYVKDGLKKAYYKTDRLRKVKIKIKNFLKNNKKIYNIYIKLKRSRNGKK